MCSHDYKTRLSMDEYAINKIIKNTYLGKYIFLEVTEYSAVLRPKYERSMKELGDNTLVGLVTELTYSLNKDKFLHTITRG